MSQPFWDAARQGALILQQCVRCQAYRFYPREWCAGCLSGEARWVPAPGSARVYSHTTVYRAPSPEFEARLPYVVGLVEYPSAGVRMMGLIEQVSESDDLCDLPVRLLPSSPKSGLRFAPGADAGREEQP